MRTFFLLLLFLLIQAFCFPLLASENAQIKPASPGTNIAPTEMVEKDVTLEGVYELSISESVGDGGHFLPESVRYHPFLITDENKKYILHFREKPPFLLSGSRIRVTGKLRGEEIFVLSDEQNGFHILQERNPADASRVEEVSILELIKPAFAATPRTLRVAVVLAKFQNYSTEPYTPSFVRDMMFTDAKSAYHYFQEVSFRKLRTEGDVFGWYTIPFDYPSDCTTFSHYIRWDAAARNALQAEGHDPQNYDAIVYAYSLPPRCNSFGHAAIGGTWSHIHGISFNQNVVIHELGHILGLEHANRFSCRNSKGEWIGLSGTCENKEYGDPYDVMGLHDDHRHFNTYSKGRLGWYDSRQMVDVTTTGDYKLSVLEKIPPTAIPAQLLRIPIEMNKSREVLQYYYIEARQIYGFDDFSPYERMVNGILVHVAPPFVLPSTARQKDYHSYLISTEWSQFRDEARQLYVTVLGRTKDAATIRVQLGPSINIRPHGGGRIVSSPAGLNCSASGGVCVRSFPQGTTVALTAIPEEGFSLFSWNNPDWCPDSDLTTCRLTVNSPIELAPFFVENYYSIVTVAGNGIVRSSPPGIDCGRSRNSSSGCRAVFPLGFPVTFTATSLPGSFFVKWEDDCHDFRNRPSCTVRIPDPPNPEGFPGRYKYGFQVTAIFESNPVQLTVAKSGGGGGEVVSTPPGIDCGQTCAVSFPSGTQVRLWARPGSNSSFLGWQFGGPCGGSTQRLCSFTLDRSLTATALFQQQTVQFYPVTIIKSGNGSGAVVSYLGPGGGMIQAVTGIQCGQTCSYPFTNGTVITLSAQPDRDSHFMGWPNGLCDASQTSQNTTTTSCTLTVTGPLNLNVHFQRNPSFER